MNFIALDFETANSSRASVCSIGLIEYKEGSVIREYYKLIKPKNNYFAPMNTRVHGITQEDVSDAEEFDILWKREIKPLLEGRLIISHNAKFDMGVLRAVLDQYHLPYPMLAYNCTLNISKKTWSLPKYNLNVVSAYLGFTFRHHQALDDARAAAHIFLCAKEELGAVDSRDLVNKTGTTNGVMYEHGYEPARLNNKKPVKKEKCSAYPATTNHFDPAHPFYKASIVFTGKLKSLKREEAIQKVVDLGAKFQPSIESTTNFIIVGEESFKEYMRGNKTSKLEQVETFLSQGYPIEIIPESDFLQYFPSSSMN
ncbi:DNA polymerase-3 subunit epsilon [Halobacillus karajensis]|uniref:DNA polymerase III PolC-type n=1 Tax=Halobacillus karajensis TaxID=195088 RepID=A0A024P1A1_9BACI|nr:exonuclease domain-containing protein [Halobacillus karajensis]CDQ19599.1 DNA polymerase III PolC-type [Halobacillus karajensis]CDQ22059.1 DNA polymerase III PolC-type [Halobacillus karajensis]CDQ27900.1 DNA polymerase III PolC-type [Halobacillus karajensis]SEH79724.1 DNA polymerase-3 subunit epsilon [Halobacillus karajensis]